MVQNLGQDPASDARDIQQMSKDFQTSTDILCKKMNQKKASLGMMDTTTAPALSRGTYVSPSSDLRDLGLVLGPAKSERYEIVAAHARIFNALK